MNEDARLRAIALFFFFSLPSEALAKMATAKVLRTLERKIQRDRIDEREIAPIIVDMTHRLWTKLSRQRQRKSQTSLPRQETGWLVPEATDVGPWRQFQKDGDAEELLAVVWSRILSFSDIDISRGLGVTVGTVRHRVGRGLRHLGALQSMGTGYV